MSSNNNLTTSWASLMKLASQVKGKSELTTDELQNILKVADKNNDGLLELQEFKDAFLSAEEYMNLEEEFLVSFEEISKFDNDEESISKKDIENAIKEYDKSLKTETPSTGSADFYSNNNTSSNNKSEDLSSKDSNELKSGRSGILSDISSKRAEKEKALSQANLDIDTKQQVFDDATKAFSELVNSKLEAEKTTNEYAKEIAICEDKKNTINGEIQKQQGTINETTALISTLSSSLSSLSEPPENIEYFNEETQQTETQKNPAYDAYLEQKAALEEELAQAEADLAEQEEVMKTLEFSLTEAEAELMEQIDAYLQAEEAAGTLTQEEKDAKDKIDVASEAYHGALLTKSDVESVFDKEIDELQSQLIDYNDAITEKELELPDGYSVKDGKITDGKNNLAYLANQQLPEGYRVDGSSIKDKDGNVVGKVTGSEENPQLYLIEEIDPPQKSFSEIYDIARGVFEITQNPGDEAVAPLWEGLFAQEYSPSDLEKIQELYNGFVSEYNANLDEGETPANEYLVQAEKELSGSDKAKEIYNYVVETLDKAKNRIEIKPNDFSLYLNGKNIDIINAMPEELQLHLDAYIKEKYDTDYNEDYYPPISDEKLKKYLGEGGLDSLAEADESTVQKKIVSILSDDELTPYEQMQLVATIKDYSTESKTFVDNYFKQDDSFFYEKLEEMSSAKNSDGSLMYSQEDMLEFVRQYKGLDSSSSLLDSAKNNEIYLNTVLSLYEKTANPENLTELDSFLPTSVLVDMVQGKFSIEEAQKYTEILFNASIADVLDENGKLSTNPENYGLNEDDASTLAKTYIDGSGSKSEKVDKVLTALDKGEITQSDAQYVISKLFDGNPNQISNLQNISADTKIKQIFELFDSKPYQAFGNGVEFAEPIYIKEGEYQYALIGPKNVDPNEELPLIVYLPGGGEYKGGAFATVGTNDRNGNGQIDKNDRYEYKDNAIGNIVSDWDLKDFNGYIIVPTLNDSYIPNWFNENAEKYVRGVVQSFKDNHNVNDDMVFVGGNSLGGQGALYMAEHVDDVFSKAFVMSAYADEVGRYNVNNVEIPMIGYVGKSNDWKTSDSGYMDSFFANKVGDENLVTINRAHGKVPINAFRRDADGDGKSDLIEWLLEDQALPENSDEY